MNAGKAVYGILSTNTDVTDIVGTKIFPEVAEQESDLPLIVYQLQSVAPEDTHDGPSKLDEVRFEFLCYADTYNGAADLADKVRGALDRVSGTYNAVNVESVQFNDVDIDVINAPRRYGQVLTFTFRIKRDDVEIAQGTPVTGAMLGDLYDVNVTGVTDNQILSYDEATDSWIPADDASGLVDSVNGQTGNVSLGLDDLTDVDAGQPEAGQLLSYGQGDWTTIGQDEIEIPIASVTNLQTELDGIPTELDDLSDVKIIGTPTEGEALVYQSGFFQLGQAGATELGDLDDVNTTGAGFGSLLTYNGATWDISAGELPSDAIYFHQRYATESEALRAGATATVELYFTCTAQGNGLAESASSDTPTAGKIIKRKIYYSEAGFADPDTGTWVEFTPAPADDASFSTVKAALLEYLKARTGGTVPISLKQTWEEVDDVPAFVGLLNETYGSGAEAAYSTRRLNGNVTECMVIRRASDSTTTTIGFDGEDIDESAITTFCTGTTCTVETWKDQSGNGNDATQSTPADQPTIYTGGAIVKDNGRVALDFDGSNDKFTLGFSIANSDALSYFYTGNYIGSGAANQWMIQTSESPQLFVPVAEENDTNTSIIFGVSSPSYYASGTSVTLANRGDVYAAFAGKQTLSTIFGTSAVSLSSSYLGGRVGNSYMMNGLFEEFIFYTSDKSTDRTDIESNIGDYFTQNTPLLDTYTGAAACYSLRLMRTAYTGDAVEVYNGSAYADIGFNVFGELDTVALAAHCGSNDGFIRTWYDQAGSNDATQSTTANMPKIYDGTTGVILQNGKPAITRNASNALFFDINATITSTVEFTIFSLYEADYDNRPFQFNNANYAGSSNGNPRMYQGAFIQGSQAYSQPAIHSYLFASTDKCFMNGVERLSGDAGTTAFTQIRFLGGQSSTFRTAAYMQEVIYYASNESSNRTGIETNLNTFYDIY